MIKYLGEEFDKQMVREGIYNTEFEYNFDHELTFKGVRIKDKYNYDPIVDDGERYVEPYGVCDHYEQILNLAPEIINSEKKYVIGLTLVKKEWEPEDGGWRWHKWGEYIGNQSPQCEYIYDEPEIEQVYCYYIYEIE
ncbi:hypothetical protein ACIFOE_12895 [Paenibacillus sp. NRS-1783]|uniref:hypothetical protein n=1 Tax=Paenibacillus sp. NRS-1783 TaxID=3233907 RepID=UPI003D2DBECB